MTTLQSNKAKIERRVKKAKITLMRKPEFALWSGIMMIGKTEVRDGFPTACTNGRDEIYGTEFVDGLTDKELMFVVLHENLHKAFRHLVIWKKLHDEDARLANMACDYVINLILHYTDPNEQTIAIPRKDGEIYGLLDTKYKGLNTKQVFDLLKKEQQEGSGSGGQGQDGDGGFDEHDWEGAQELTDAEVKELEREVDQALRQGQMTAQKLAGKGAGGMHRELGDLLEPQVDWREVLREFVNATCNAKDASSWRRVNRRYLSMDMYMPSLVGERVGHVVIGGDTSASIQEELKIFITEMQSILDMVNPEKTDVFYWDCEIASHETYDSATLSTLAQTTQPKGGGGTDPTCVMRHLNENSIKPDCIIMFTDGCIYDWGNEWNAPILWVVVGDATAPVGKTLNIKDGLQ
jgi:predicted metal-dependent peptidase